ncbi:MAG: CesT family type III secretion system chaperone [Verrucomicrobia bacterium]|nr:CesT family type III secretion system chaperone [Verrucomicrobiota bacterium]MDE3048018.1 CesT family type III secretion system chaperone [Verrucomicrobiota bacterium]
MIGRFEELLHELGSIFHLQLHIDREHACSIQVHPHLILQLQLDTSQENLWIFAEIAETPPGKFRENILKEALKANALPDPMPGIFGYILATNRLAQFQKYPLHILTAERLSQIIGAFLEMAEVWQKAIMTGQSAPIEM